MNLQHPQIDDFEINLERTLKNLKFELPSADNQTDHPQAIVCQSLTVA